MVIQARMRRRLKNKREERRGGLNANSSIPMLIQSEVIFSFLISSFHSILKTLNLRPQFCSKITVERNVAIHYPQSMNMRYLHCESGHLHSYSKTPPAGHLKVGNQFPLIAAIPINREEVQYTKVGGTIPFLKYMSPAVECVANNVKKMYLSKPS